MEFPPPPVPVESVDPTTLKRRIDAGETVTVLDTRPSKKYETWQIRGETVRSYNVPYTAFEGGDIEDGALDGVPTDDTITTVCAIGKSSEYVAGVLADHGYNVEHLADGMDGWAHLYERVELTRYDGSGRVWQYQRPSSGCLGYLVVDGAEAAVVDPLRAFADRYPADAADHGAELTRAVDTHVHADHVSGVRELARGGVDGLVPTGATDRGLADPDRLGLLADGDQFTVGSVDIEAVHTPGHTTEMTGLLVGGALLLSGDCLFLETVARPDLEAGADGAPDAAGQLYESLHGRVFDLPDATLIGPGHHGEHTGRAADRSYTARLGAVRDRDVFSLPHVEFVDTVCAEMPPRPANYREIIATNLGRRETDDDEAFELELGPNNCAAGASTADLS
jgi:glyoxylase-like metal-dependent hydrolase (beta-lactamase superfamily II)/rhodanese-related sulfurtransferase